MKNLSSNDLTIFLTDGGFETELIYKHNIELPHFAAFPLIEIPKYRSTLKNYYQEYLDLAKKYKTGFILESPTWRANKDWGYKLGYSENDLVRVNQEAIALLLEIKKTNQKNVPNILISGQLGPQADGYQAEKKMTIREAQKYHDSQIKVLKNEGVAMVSAITMTYLEEALGIVHSAQENNIPVVISFTVETDGHLPSGMSLKKAILEVDKASGNYPLYYMINCAHPSHFIDVVEVKEPWILRIKGIRANASCKSHAELDELTTLDSGNPNDLGNWHSKLKKLLPELIVFGGCCGTNATHVDSICKNAIKEHSLSL